MSRSSDLGIFGPVTLATNPPEQPGKLTFTSRRILLRGDAVQTTAPGGLLSRLPPEIRCEIYKHLFRGSMYAVVLPDRMERRVLNGIQKRFDQDIISILQTCRLFRTEASIFFRRLVTVAFVEADLPQAASDFSSTLLDVTQLTQVGIIGMYSTTCLPVYLQTKCPKLETLHLTMYNTKDLWWEPLRVLIGEEDSDLTELAQNAVRLNHVFFALIRYDWLANGRVAQVSEDVAHQSYVGPRVLFSCPVVFEQSRGVPLQPDCNGGCVALDPKTKIVRWDFRGSTLTAQYYFGRKTEGGKLEWSIDLLD